MIKVHDFTKIKGLGTLGEKSVTMYLDGTKITVIVTMITLYILLPFFLESS